MQVEVFSVGYFPQDRLKELAVLQEQVNGFLTDPKVTPVEFRDSTVVVPAYYGGNQNVPYTTMTLIVYYVRE